MPFPGKQDLFQDGTVSSPGAPMAWRLRPIAGTGANESDKRSFSGRAVGKLSTMANLSFQKLLVPKST